MMEMLERSTVLTMIRQRLQNASTGGHVILLSGEAGIGKTMLLQAAAVNCSAVWWGRCDALETPHLLAPLLDIAREVNPKFKPFIAGPRPALFHAVLDELRSAATPVLMVIEDAHWADDATLDLLKFLGRRILSARALLVISFRDDEVGMSHPLRRVMGDLPSSTLTRIALERLSAQAVEHLAALAGRSASGVYAATRGNPFFVIEMLREEGDTVPRSVQDLVLARLSRLPPSAQSLMHSLAVIPGQAEAWLVNAVHPPSLSDIEVALASGLLVSNGEFLAFRHDLARVAVESAISYPQQQYLHGRVLAALVAADHDIAPARLVHHAQRAHDNASLRKFAPIAAEQASARGAQREAAAFWQSSLGGGIASDEVQRQSWLEAWATECQLTGNLVDAIAARLQLGVAYAKSGNVVRQAHNLSHSALLHVLALNNAQAGTDCLQAIALLEPLAPCIEKAYAWWVNAQLLMLNREWTASIEWSSNALTLAEKLGERETQVASLGTLGTATMFIDYDQGVIHLQKALEMAKTDGLHWVAANTYSNLGSGAGELFHLHDAQHWLTATMDYTE